VEEFTLGCHLVSSRQAYTHHGIYIGADEVIHYAGKSGDVTAPDSSIRVTTLKKFRAGSDCTVRGHPNARYTGQEVVDRARSCLGKNGYHWLANNCEHFCNWAIDDVHESGQVERGSVLTGSVLYLLPTSRRLQAPSLLRHPLRILQRVLFLLRLPA
jgi:hypothetical protein